MVETSLSGRREQRGRPKQLRRLRPLLLAMAAIFVLGACEQAIQVRGNIPDPELVSEIEPGLHNRNDIANMLGSPSTISTFKDSKWYYIGQKMTQFAFLKPEILERSVVVVSFDTEGVVDDTALYTLEDGQIIDPISRKTPTEGREFTLLQQLLGNLGKFSGTQNQ